MRITVHSSKALKPAYSGSRAGAAPAVIPLTVFDEVHLDEYMSGIHAFHPPSPTSAVLEAGLARALAEYPEWAGRLVTDASTGRTVILLDADDDDDACGGVRFVEATADVDLETALPLLQPAAPEVRLLHPSSDGAVEIMLVQVTRFTCGSFVVGHTMHHAVGDGLGICHALLAWGQATRGAAIDPVPVHDRTSFFVPRDPPQVDFEHRGVEFSLNSKATDADEKKKHLSSSSTSSGDDDDGYGYDDDEDDDVVEDVVTHKVHFSREFISSLKLQAVAASAGTGRTYSTTQCVVAHLWRSMAEARRLEADQVTTLHIAVNGRGRMRCPHVPAGYTGNVVLWAHPSTTAGELLAARPLSDVAEVVRRAVARVDDAYFRSFIDFISSGAVEEEGLLPMSDAAECPDAEVYCLRRIPFYDLNFAGGGQQFLFIPSYDPADGLVYILPSSPLDDDGSIEAHVSLFSSAMEAFKDLCSSKAVA